MSPRTSGDVPRYNQIRGGNPQPRPDQILQPTSRAGTGPAPQSQVFIGRLAIIFGTGAGTGLFVYSGAPKLGNPPILAITTASADPYGNTVTPSAITDAGMPLLMYTGGAGTGNLRTSLSPAAGSTVDSFGNTVEPGFFNGNLSVPGAGFVQIAGGLITFGISSQIAGGLQAGIIAGLTPGVTEIFGDFASGTDVQTVTQLQSQVNGGSFIISQAGLDANSYDTARKTLRVGVAQTITSTSNTLLTGLSANVGVGKYRISGVIFCFQGGAAFGQVVGFSGPAITAARIFTNWMNDSAGGTVNGGSMTTLTTQTSPAYAPTTNFYFIFDGLIEFGAAGTFEMVAAEGTATHQFQINRDSYCDLMPVTT